MKQYRFSFCLFLFLVSACGNVAVADPVPVTASPSSTNTPWLTYTPSPYPGAITTTPTLLPMGNIMGNRFSACKFPLAGSATESSLSEDYVFLEPRVVPTDPDSTFFEIMEWLPDSERALIVRDVLVNQDEEYHSIEILNPLTIQVQTYAKRSPIYGEPLLWVEGLKAVIYTEGLEVSSAYDEGGMVIPSSIVDRQLLWLSNGDPDRAQKLREVEFRPASPPYEPIIFSLAAKPDGSRIVFVESDGAQSYRLYQHEVLQGSLGTEQLVPFDAPSPDDPRQPGPLNRLTRMTWQPGTSHVVFYNIISLTDPTFLVDADTGQACGLDFGGWVYLARWSPNGRYLAVIKSTGAMNPFTLDYDLVVLDAITGTLYQVDAAKLSPPDLMDMGVHKVIDFTWAPDNRHIAAVGSVSFAGSSPPPSTERLFLIDFLSGYVEPILPSYEFDLQCYHWGAGLVWSPDGSKLLAACPELRLISVQKSDP